MTEFRSYDNFEDMFADIQKGVDQAKARMTPEQAAITYGDYWIRPWESFLIFGHIYGYDEMWEKEKEAGATKEEIEYEKKIYASSYENGFRFGRAYSVIEPNGELGDTHVTDMYKITKEQFEEAKAVNWAVEEIVNFPWFRELAEKYG